MSSFTSPLHVEVLENGKEYRILEEFIYYRSEQKDIKIVVEKGFITDFASVPRIFWSIFPPFGVYTKSAVLHDRLCVAFLKKQTWLTVLQKEIKEENIKKDINNIESIEKENKSNQQNNTVSLENIAKSAYPITRKEADKIFLESMEAVKVPYFTRLCLYYSVRLYAILKYGFKA